MAGNVMILLRAGTEAAVLANMARYLGGQGERVVLGFQLDRPRPGATGFDLGSPPLRQREVHCLSVNPAHEA